jgi:hypothetical protein
VSNEDSCVGILTLVKGVNEFLSMIFTFGAHGGAVVETLCYKPEGSGIDSQWCHWNFSLT